MKKILLLLLFTVASYGQAVFDEGIQITGNANSATATKVNVQEANGKVNTQTINTGFNKNIGLGGSDVVGANTLLNQYSTTPVDWTATTFASGKVVFYGGKQWIAKMATVAGDVPAVSSKWEEITFEALANKTTTVDQTIIDGSTNAVSGNAVFDGLALKSNIGHTHVASQITDLSKASVGLGNVDNTSDLSKPLSTATINALATKAPISSVHNPVTIGTANGLSLSNQQISLGLASSGVTGALSGTDWNTFNGKFNTPTGLTNNYLPKWDGSGFGNSNIVDTNNEYYFENTNGRLTFGTSLSETYIFSTTTSFTSFKKLKITSNNLVFNNGTTDLFSFLSNGRALFNTTTDNGVDEIQVNGTISASPATTANQVVVKSQLDAVAASSGRYTPTVNVITGVTSVSVQSHTYTKIGNIVTVYGESLPTPVVTSVPVIYEISLPIARANTTTTKAIGFGGINVAGGSVNQPVRLESSSATTVRIAFNIAAAGTPSVLYSFQYDITQ